MTLLTAVQNALNEIGEFEVPDSIVGSGNETAKRMLALAKREGDLLARAHPWSRLATEYTFATVASQADYDLPAGFSRYLNGTWWDRVNRWPLFGPASPAQWQRLQSQTLTAGLRRWWRQRGGEMLLFPTPSANGDTIAYEYISTYWCQSAAGVAQATWAADSDVFRLDERLLIMGLKWRWLQVNGFDYSEEKREYDDELEAAKSRDGGAQTLDLSAPRYDDDLAYANIPDTGIGT